MPLVNHAREGEHMIKAAFFDIDGTLLSKATDNLIPQSTKDALVELRRRGVMCFIASGRPTAQLPWCIKDGFEGFEGGFDSYITLTGSLCYDKDGVYADTPLDPAFSRRFIDLATSRDLDMLYLNRDGVFCNRKSDRVRELEEMVAYDYPVGDPQEALKHPLYQFCLFVGPEKDAEVAQAMDGCIVTRWCDIFCDVVPGTSSKPEGIKAALAHYGLKREETIAFGDGGNDATMLEFCQIGVAMGNGTAEAKAAADYITANCEDDGIAKALRHFDLI